VKNKYQGNGRNIKPLVLFLVSRHLTSQWASQVASGKRICLSMQKTRVQFLGLEDPLEKGMVTHTGILAWRTPWTEGPERLQPMGSQKVGYD
jgi:hypothetical protein